MRKNSITFYYIQVRKKGGYWFEPSLDCGRWGKLPREIDFNAKYALKSKAIQVMLEQKSWDDDHMGEVYHEHTYGTKYYVEYYEYRVVSRIEIISEKVVMEVY